ncbi:MAG: hypothetical protein ACR2QF_07325 [Geminicoccaceae bacterium]
MAQNFWASLRKIISTADGLNISENTCHDCELNSSVVGSPAENAKPWFGSRYAPWSIPSKRIQTHQHNDRYRGQFFYLCDGSINLNTHEWAIAKYYFNDFTPRTNGLDIEYPKWCNLGEDMRLPWDPAWRHADDADSYTTLVEKDTGKCFLIWKTRYDAARNVMRCNTATVVMAGYKPRGGPIANIWTKGNGFEPSAAAGIALPHMLVTREEIDAGVIPHCLRLALPKPSRDTRFNPATKSIGRTGSAEPDRLGTGVRIAFDSLSHLDIDLWSEEFPDQAGRHLATIGRAVKDYGFLVVDNGGNERRKRGSVYFENNLSANWDELGLTRDLTLKALYSLLQPNLGKMRILAEPEFPEGDFNRTARYPGIDYPDDLI